MVRQEGLEPATYCLEGSCSIQLSYWRIMERVTGIEPASPAWKAGALAVVLHPRHSDKFSLRIIPYRGRSVKGFFAFLGLCCSSGAARRLAELAAVGAAERRIIPKAAGARRLQDRHTGGDLLAG